MQSRIKLCNAPCWPQRNWLFYSGSSKPTGLSGCSSPQTGRSGGKHKKVTGFACNIVLRHLRVCKQTRLRVCVKISQDLDSIFFGWVHNEMQEKEGGGARKDQLKCPASYRPLLANIKLNEHRASPWYVWKPWEITQWQLIGVSEITKCSCLMCVSVRVCLWVQGRHWDRERPQALQLDMPPTGHAPYWEMSRQSLSLSGFQLFRIFFPLVKLTFHLTDIVWCSI